MVARDHPAETVFCLPLWAASLAVMVLFGRWLFWSLRTGTSTYLGLMPRFQRASQPVGYWLAVSIAGFFFLAALLSLVMPSWISYLPGD